MASLSVKVYRLLSWLLCQPSNTHPIITTKFIIHVTVVSAFTEASKLTIYGGLATRRYLDILLALISPAKASMQYMTTHHIPRNQPLIFQPSTGPSPLPHNSSQYLAPDHVLGASGSTAYYTPSHSHAPTENDQLPSPAFPTPGTYKP